jgi:sec-independent protein translocase protein TatA
MNIGWGELVVIFAIVLLLVGARRLPEIGRSLGEAIREFQRALRRKS